MIRQHNPFFRIFGALVLLGAALALAQAPQTLPSMEGESLTGQKVEMPSAARGKVSVLIFGFSKASKKPTSAWADKIFADFGAQPEFALYQLPVLEDVPRLVRGMVISGMRKGERENMRDHFVPLLHGEKELKAFVHFKEPDDAYLVLLDRSGQVAQQIHGPFDADAYAHLRTSIQSVLNQQN